MKVAGKKERGKTRAFVYVRSRKEVSERRNRENGSVLYGLRLNRMEAKRSVDLMTLARDMLVESGLGVKNELETRKWR